VQFVRHVLHRQRQHQHGQSRRGDRGHPEDRHDQRRDGADRRQGFRCLLVRPGHHDEVRLHRRLRRRLATGDGAGLTGKLGTIERSDGSAQATFDGHPLYTFVKDTGPGTDTGNGVDAFGGLWHALTASGSAAPASTPSGSSSQHHSAPPSHAAVTTPAAPPATAPAQTANPIPQGNGGDQDADNNGGPSDGDGNI
jgi:hypothetical protein